MDSFYTQKISCFFIHDRTKIEFYVIQFGSNSLKEEEMTAENVKKQMTDEEWQKVYDMSKDKNLYQNLCSSLFPTIHGQCNYRVIKTNIVVLIFVY